MSKLLATRKKLNDYMTRTGDMSKEEMREVLEFMIEVSNDQINRSLNLNQEIQEQNKTLSLNCEQYALSISILKDFISAKNLNKEFEFYLRGLGTH